VTAEDCLCAGAIATGIREAAGNPSWTDDSTKLAVEFFAAHSKDHKTFQTVVRTSWGGRNLRQLGFAADIDRAATWDLFPLVPEYSPESGRIQAVQQPETIEKQWLAAPAG